VPETEVAIDSLDEEGRGVGVVGGRRVHVAGTLPGETCRAAVEHRSPHKADDWGRLVSLSVRSPERVEPACPAFGDCGGCSLQHWRYDAQLAWKQGELARVVGDGEIVGSAKQLGYRNKAKLVAGPGVLGSFAPASHRLVDMRGCRVPEPAIEPVLETLRGLVAGVPVYDEKAGTGELRHVVVRANVDGEIQVVLVTRTAVELTAIARELRRRHPEVRGVVQDVNATRGGGVHGWDWRAVDGDPWLFDRVGPVTLRLSPLAFFQVNREQAARLYGDAAGFARDGRVIDLFCGAGGIALTAAAAGAKVVGVEVHPGAVEDARASSGGTAAFVVGEAAAGLSEAIARLGGVDTIVVDPPRKGLGAAIAPILAAAPQRIVYVSCDMRSLARDLAALRGYERVALRGYDLMPGTPHLEVLAVLEKR
jgi:23S rRNA (uracil1939-C5)-methyltransferase